MKKSAICITLATLALAGCNNDEKNAQARLPTIAELFFLPYICNVLLRNF